MSKAADPQRRRRTWRRVGLLAATPLLLLLALDLTRPAGKQWSGKGLVAGIGLYRQTLSPQLARLGVRCRFTPTCSRYAADSIRRRGAARGTARAAWRLFRCGPWTPAGTVDPP